MPASADRSPPPPSPADLEPLRPVGLLPSGTLSLPRPLTSFIGREREIELVADRLLRDDVRLVTLTGPGGVGKTRLAIRVGEAVRGVFSDGIWFVALAPVRDPALVTSTIADVLGVHETATRTLAQGLVEVLRDRRALLILDNFEHLLESGPLLTDLLASCPDVTVLVTSRAALHLSGEHDIAVPPLSLLRRLGEEAVGQEGAGLSHDVSEAVALFWERARATRADCALTAANQRTVAEICRRLDGLPLAIELAAARVNVLSPASLLTKLEQRLPLLTGGARDQPARLRSMRDAIAWSYDLLDVEERALYRRLAVFVGGFTLETAEWVEGRRTEDRGAQHASCGVLEGLTSLADKSLLRHDVGAGDASRYSMLETVREFGLEQLQAHGEVDTARDAHLAWFVTLVERLCPPIHGPERATWLDQLEPEHDNLRAALAWSLKRGHGEAALRLSGALRDFWYLRGHLIEGRRWLEAAVAIGTDASVQHRARALFGLGWFTIDLGDLERGTAALKASLALYRELGDRLGIGLALDLLGCAAEDHGDYALAERLMTEARSHFVAVDNRHGISQSTFHLGVIAQGQGDLDLALARYAESERLARAEGDAFNITNNLFYRSLIHCRRGQLASAAEAVAEALALERAARSDEGVSTCLAILAVQAAAVGLPEASIRLLRTAARMKDRLGLSFDFPERVDYDRARHEARSQIREAAFQAAWDTGWARTLEEAEADVEAVLAAGRSQPEVTKCEARDETGLTPRDREILRLVAQGRSNREIAETLFISVPTVKRHLTNILGKLELPSRSALNTYAHTRGLV
jgi:predicted ATPase/DNA-binding CsgD family transcriptional regulator